MKFNHLPLLLFFCCGYLGSVKSAKIFFMIPLTTISEKNLYTPLIHELGQRGHQVTVATIKKTNQNSKNVKEFIPLSYDEFFGKEEISNPRDSRELGRMQMYNFETEFKFAGCRKVYENAEFKAAISEQYDLVFTNFFWFGLHCFAGVLHRQGVPFIILNSMAPVPYVYELSGYKLPMSIVPNPLIMPTDRMGFLQRVENTIFDCYRSNFEKYSSKSAEKIYRHYLGQDIPGGLEIASNVSLIFSNSHFTFNAPTPVMPDIVEIGGIHCRPPKPLPKELKEWADGAKEGFIYFSMGSMVQARSMPKEWVDIFISVFSKLKLKVLWKWDGEPEDLVLPKNVHINKWLPQQDVLGHPNCKLFMTHGGALSTQESLYHGIPVVGFPIFVDQDLNSQTAENKGFGIRMEILDLAPDTLEKTINQVLNDPKYATKAKELSAIFKDQRETPLERAVYYTEYAIRHKGAHHLRSVGRDLSFAEYYLWDVFAFILFVLLTFFSLIFFLLRSIFCLIFNKKGSAKDTKKKRN